MLHTVRFCRKFENCGLIEATVSVLYTDVGDSCALSDFFTSQISSFDRSYENSRSIRGTCFFADAICGEFGLIIADMKYLECFLRILSVWSVVLAVVLYFCTELITQQKG